jgi:acetyl esterase/lipase
VKSTVILTLICIVVLPVLSAAQEQPQSRAKSKQAQTVLPEGVRVLRDIEYAKPGGKPQLLDLYLPEGTPEKPLPVVVWVHGGGWNAGSKERCPGVWLAAEGYAVASINYRLTTEAQWPAQIDDCRAAVRWLRANANAHRLDGARIAAWGGSAGGHLVALMGTLDAPVEERVQAVIDWYGPTDLLTMPPNVLSETRTREQLAKSNGAQLLGGIVMDQPEKAKGASALYQASAGDAPFLIMHGEKDPGVPLAQSERLHEKLKEAGVESTLHVIPGAGHGGKEFNTPEVRKVVQEFLGRQLKK